MFRVAARRMAVVARPAVRTSRCVFMLTQAQETMFYHGAAAKGMCVPGQSSAAVLLYCCIARAGTGEDMF